MAEIAYHSFQAIFQPRNATYAQKNDSGARLLFIWKRNRYKLHSDRKWLIYKDF